MDLNIRKAVTENLNNSSYDEIKKTIVDAMNIPEEKVLPGLGVIFEIYWKNCDDMEKEKVVDTITKSFS